MRKAILFTSVLLLSVYSFAQQFTSYNKSVYRNMPAIHDMDKEAATRKNIQARFPGWSIGIDIRSNTFKDIFGKAIVLPGNTTQDKINNCFSEMLRPLGLHAAEWKQTRLKQYSKATFADYVQYIDDHKVAFSKLSFWFTPDNKLQRIQMRNYGMASGRVPKLSATDAAIAAAKDLQGANITSNVIDKDWVWFAVPVQQTYELHPAWHFTVKGTINKTKMQLSGYIDALTGEVVYRTSDIDDVFDLKLNSSIYVTDPSDPASLQPMRNMAVFVDLSTLTSDTSGYCSSAALSVPATATVMLQGSFAQIVDVPTGITPFTSVNVVSTGSVFNLSTSVDFNSRQLNAYYHANRAHDYMKTVMPSFTDLDIAMRINVDDPTGECNAFFNSSDFSLNFFAAGGGCNSFAQIGSVVYHEYGHAITGDIYTVGTGFGIGNTALDEGSSDVWAMCVSRSPILGKNSSSGGTLIRRYDQTPRVYPYDLVGEGHEDGQIIAGAWWDLAQKFGSIDSMARLFVNMYDALPDGPNGTEGDLYHSILVSALLFDDNDGNLSNGTRNFSKITSAFARHGIYLVGDLNIFHTELNNQKSSTQIPVSAQVFVTYPDFFHGLRFFYRNRDSAAWQNPPVTVASSIFSSKIAPQPSGSVIDYYFAVRDTLSFIDRYEPFYFDPTVASISTSLPYQFGVGLGARDSFTFETPAAKWHIGLNPGDNATSGRWIQDIPVISFGWQFPNRRVCQPGNDNTTGSGKCLITGNALETDPAGTNDVDGGGTSVITPVFDLSTFSKPVISYYRWYSNDKGPNPGSDTWRVQMRDTTTSTWVTVDATTQSDILWRRRIFAVNNYLPTGKYIQLKFIAADSIDASKPFNNQSNVEAGIDDFFIYDNRLADVEEVENNLKAHIFPNPANNALQVQLAASANSGNIAIYDLNGKMIYTMAIEPSQTNYTINTLSFVPGQYMLFIQSNNFIQSQKLIINH